MNSLAEIINPIDELTVQACETAVKAFIDATVAAASAFAKLFSRACEEFSKLISKIISPRVVFLAAHAKKESRSQEKQAAHIKSNSKTDEEVSDERM